MTSIWMRSEQTASRTSCIAAEILLVGPGCATSPSSWPLERARQLRHEGKPASALRLTEQELQRRYEDPETELVELRVGILSDMDRTTEADSFREFVDRYRAGVDAFDVGTGLTWKDCRSSQPGSDLIRSWGDPTSAYVPFALDLLAATFEIDREGRIGEIEVVRAPHPGGAWMLIQSIGTAKVSPMRLADRNETEPDSFPLPLCVWWSSETDPDGGVVPIRDFWL